jgi:glutamate decarboxylase
MFTSSHSHYSIEKAAMVLGIGTNQVIQVECDAQGRMLPDALGEFWMYKVIENVLICILERAIIESKNRGEIPFYVNATSGTTVTVS